MHIWKYHMLPYKYADSHVLCLLRKIYISKIEIFCFPKIELRQIIKSVMHLLVIFHVIIGFILFDEVFK